MKDNGNTLPIASARVQLIFKLKQINSAIILGETGSGKTTQIPKYIYQEKLHGNGLIACTQPRRVAAISIANRVSEEMECPLGSIVGYNVRFEEMTSAQTKIIYMTDGMLLREALLDPLLKKYTFIILDEAHERTLNTDVLFAVVKSAQKIRKEKGNHHLKILVMSATMDVDKFSSYFNNAPVLYIEGRQHEIQIMYTKQSQHDYLKSTLIAVFQLHQERPANEDILVFMTGQDEIESIVKTIKDVSKNLTDKSIPIIVFPLFSSLPSSKQISVFQDTPKGSRKIIVATNVAETSITIKGVKHVIDTGYVKIRSYNSATNFDLLKVERISQAQAWQRAGRAGRESDGNCFRLYSENDFFKMPENSIPEILRCNLSNVVLQLLVIGIKDVLNFDFMDQPSKELMLDGLQHLKSLGAVEEETNSITVKDAGKKMAAFPLEPRLSKVILASQQNHCLQEVLSIVSMLCTENVLHTPANKKDEAFARRHKFNSIDGDHFMLLNIYRAFKSTKGNLKNWCKENFINARAMNMAVEIRRQLRDICQRLQFNFESCGHDMVPIKKSFCAGFFINAATLTKDKDYLTATGKKKVAIHPSSSMFQHKPATVIYHELIETTCCYMRNICVVDEEWLKGL